MLAIVGGLAAALCWAASSMSSSRSARAIGAWSTVAWVMVLGTIVTVPATIAWGGRPSLTPDSIVLLVVAGVSNVAGLVLVYSALKIGKVSVIAPITSTEGAMGAVIAIVLGEQVAVPVAATLAMIAGGVILAASEGRPPEAIAVEPGALAIPSDAAVDDARADQSRARDRRILKGVALALTGAFLFGINLYTVARINAEMSPMWSILPARLAGTFGIALPLLLLGRLHLTRAALPFVVVIAIGEVVGVGAYAIGSQDGIAVAAVMSSQFGAIAAISSVALFGEKLRRRQIVGVAVIAAGVAALAALQAG